jgi:hypothetical protein
MHMAEEQQSLELLKIAGPTEAEMIEEMLQNNGIDCTLQGEVAAITIPATGDLDEVRVWVNREQAAEARELLDAFFTPVKKGELVEMADGFGGDADEQNEGDT